MNKHPTNHPENMSHLPSLIYDLALILIAAGCMTLLFKWLKQPLVLGYIVAGILAGPHIDVLPLTVTDTANIQTWADIGVVFLLFALGLEFSFKKLAAVGKSAAITAVVEVAGMLLVGIIVGKMLGWSTMNCIFLGGLLSMSSTTIIIKAFNDLNLRGKPFTSLVFGVLVVEDLVAVVMMVLLSTISVSQVFDGSQLLLSTTRLIFFLALWFIFGIFLIPSFLKKTRKIMNDETLLIVSTGLCLVMVVIAVKTGFSAALGAFIMGSILAETIDVKRIENLMEPLKNFFGAIFFVSVGMMVDPAILAEYAWPVVIITLATLVGKLFFSTLGVLLSGQSPQISIQSGFSLAQIGEFAFIIASLGLSLGVTGPFLYPVVIVVSVITTFTTPYFIKLADPFYFYLKKHLPKKWFDVFNKPHVEKKKTSGQNAWGSMLKDFFTYMMVLSIVVIAILYLSLGFLYPFLQKNMSENWSASIAFLLTILTISPFLRAMMSNNGDSSSTVLNLWMGKALNRKILIFFFGLRTFAVFVTILFVINAFFPLSILINFMLSVVILVIIVRSKWLLKRFWHIESRFLINLNERQMEENIRKIEDNNGVMQLNDMQKNHWLDYKLYTCALRIKGDSHYIGQRIRDLHFRKDYNLMVIRIRTAGNNYINIPSGDYCIQKGDTLRLAGKKSSLRKLQEDEILSLEFVDHSYITLHGFSKLEFNRKKQEERITCSGLPISPKSPLAGKNLMESAIGTKTKCLVVGLEREGKQMVNPPATMTLEAGDVVWLVGEEKPVSKLIEANVYFI
ncbi:MAG: cation:proton antiporter [Bacteroidales bacterium]|nr:cation:proton antiporter [Bacteroidales bacterium]